MTQDRSITKKKKFVILGILMMILVGIWSTNQRQKNSLKSQLQDKVSSKVENTSQLLEEDFSIDSRLSYGAKILLTANNNPQKQLGVQKYQAGAYQQALTNFQDSLDNYPNDPETLIYLNNSFAALKGDSVSIAVSVPIGGSLNVAQEILRGVAQAQNEINLKGGLKFNGVRSLVKVQIANDDNSPEIAKEIAAELAADPKVMGVIGHNSSNSSLAAAPIYQQTNLVMVSPTSVARELSKAGDYIFRTTPSSRTLAESLAKYTVNTIRRQKVAICYDSGSPASTSFQEEFALSLSELGGKIVPIDCDFANQNFNTNEIPSQAVANGAEALLLVPFVNNINQALEIARVNANRLPLLGNHSMYTYETLKIGQKEIKGLILPVPWHPPLEESAYTKNARQLWGMAGNWRTAMAYDASKALLTGLNTANNRQELQQVLANQGFFAEGATGKVTFTPSGDRLKSATIVKVESGKTSGTGYDFASLQN